MRSWNQIMRNIGDRRRPPARRRCLIISSLANIMLWNVAAASSRRRSTATNRFSLSKKPQEVKNNTSLVSSVQQQWQQRWPPTKKFLQRHLLPANVSNNSNATITTYGRYWPEWYPVTTTFAKVNGTDITNATTTLQVAWNKTISSLPRAARQVSNHTRQGWQNVQREVQSYRAYRHQKQSQKIAAAAASKTNSDLYGPLVNDAEAPASQLDHDDNDMLYERLAEAIEEKNATKSGPQWQKNDVKTSPPMPSSSHQNERVKRSNYSSPEAVSSNNNATSRGQQMQSNDFSRDTSSNNDANRAMAAPSTQAPPQPTTPPARPHVIVLGGSGNSGLGNSRYGRLGTSSGIPSSTSPLLGVGGAAAGANTTTKYPPGTSPNTIILAEVAASLLSSAIRWLLLSYLARQLNRRQENITPIQHFVFETLNDEHARDELVLQTALHEPPPGVGHWRWKWQTMSRQRRTAPPRARRNLSTLYRRTVVVLELASSSKGQLDVEMLSRCVTFLLEQHRLQRFGSDAVPNDSHGLTQPLPLEIVLVVSSPGGSVAHYGLAAAQVQRLRETPQLTVTVCVDAYAASGGYMVASQAHAIVAAPFATLGSVGVIMEGLNFHEAAKRYGITPLVIKAGDSKNPFTTFGPISRKDLFHEEERLQKVHSTFQKWIVQARPDLIDRSDVLNGNVFLGREAQERGLVDVVMTSDEYILLRIRAGDRVLKLHKSQQSQSLHRRRKLSPLDLLPHLRNMVQGDTGRILAQSVAVAGTIFCLLRDVFG